MLDSALGAAILAACAILAYAGSSALYITNIFRPGTLVARGATALGVAGAALNLWALYERAVVLHSVPYRDLLGSMTLFGFFLAFLSLVLELRHHDRSLGPFLMPTALLLLVLAVLARHSSAPAGPGQKGSIFALHVTLNMLAYAAFAVASALSVLYLAVVRSLKSRSTKALSGPASRLPSLGYLERANRTSLGVGVVALFLGLALGLYWAMRIWWPEHPGWALDPKIAAAVVTFVFYLVVLVRAHRGAPPVSTAKLSLIGFALVVVSYTAVNLLFSRLHAFA